jgi:hypothetical protein
MIDLAPGYSRYASFCAHAAIGDCKDDHAPVVAMPATTVNFDDGIDDADGHTLTDQDDSLAPEREEEGEEGEDSAGKQGGNSPEEEETKAIEFNINGPDLNNEQCQTVRVNGENEYAPSNLAAELLRIHHRMGHAPFRKLQEMARQGALPGRYRNCPIPIRAACLFGKAGRKPWRGKETTDRPPPRPKEPGDVTSVDQMETSTPGLVAQISGSLTTKRYRCATVFVDQGSRLGYVHLQKTSTAEETLEAKAAWEAFARTHGVEIKAYHVDNGIFKANKWVDSCKRDKQGLTFAGVNSHHENRIAERRIKEIQEGARTMLIHANHRWKSCVNAHLWPYAVRMANDQINAMPSMQREDKQSPMQVFARTNVHSNVKHWHHFGSPVYVLEKELQTNAPFDKWRSRATVRIYIGQSPQHSRNVALVLSRSTGLVSPQYHVKHDSGFETVMEERQDGKPAAWMIRAGFVGRKEDSLDRGSKRKAKGGSRSDQPGTGEPRQKEGRFDLGQEGIDVASDHGNTGMVPMEQELPPLPEWYGNEDAKMEKGDGSSGQPDNDQQREQRLPPDSPNPFGKGEGAAQEEMRELDGRGQMTSRSGRAIRRPIRFIEAMMTKIMAKEVREGQGDAEGELFCLEALFPEAQVDDTDPLLAFKATTDPDTMYMHEAMREPDREQFREAMVKEVADQMSNGNFTIVQRSSVPEGESIMPTVWQMKRKRDIKTRAVKKWKARLNLDGSKMVKGTDYVESYSPVASWNSIRTMLILATQHGWHTIQIDYVLAFPQAPIEKTLYMEVPKGFEIEGCDRRQHCLKLHKNLYGSKNAGQTWYQYLTKKQGLDIAAGWRVRARGVCRR